MGRSKKIIERPVEFTSRSAARANKAAFSLFFLGVNAQDLFGLSL